MATLAELFDSTDIGLKDDLNDRLEQAKSAYRKQFNKELPVTSGYRTFDQQAALASKPNIYPVAKPGTSAHETGDAVDISSEVPDTFLNQFGLHRPFKNDKVHVQVMPSSKGTQSLASLWDTIDVGEEAPQKETKAEKSILSKAFEEKQKFKDIVTGLGEAGLATVSGAIMPLVAGAKGIVQSIPQAIESGQAPAPIAEKIASKFLQEHPGYQPSTPQGKSYIESLQKAFETSKLPPILPEILGQVPSAKPVTGEINEAFQAAKQLKKEPVTLPVAQNLANQLNNQLQQKGLQSVGAASTTNLAEAKAAIANAPEYMQEALKNVNPESLVPSDIKVIQNHTKAAKFGIGLTEGEALGDTTLMSKERNDRLKDPALQQRFEDRDPKLIQAFNDIKEKISPDVFENDPVRLASMPLDKMKADYDAHQLRIKNAYDVANKAAGESQSPIDVGALRENIINGLKEKGKTKYVPTELQSDLDELLGKGHLTPQEYENLRTDTATIARTNSDPLKRQAASIIRDKLEQVPIKDEFAQYKPLYDAARDEVKALKAKEKIPAYAAAISDTRSPEELLAAIPHPAANNFLAAHYSAKTPELNIQRMLDIIGRDSPEHQALNKLKIEEFKINSGIKNDKGIVSQANLNKQIYHQHQSNLPVMLGNETTKTLQDLADVANMTEHTKGVHHVNTSNTEVLAEQNRAKEAAKDFVSNVAATALEQKANMTVPFAGTFARTFLKGKAEQKALQAEALAKAEESSRRLSPIAGIKIKDIGKP